MRTALATLALLVVACAAQPTEQAAATHSKQTTAAAEPTTAKPASPTTGPRADCGDALQLLLSVPHDPPTRAQVDSACAAPVAALVQVADDDSALALRRLRAVTLLGTYDSTEAQDALERALHAELASVRRTAVAALAKHRASARRDTLLRKALEDGDPHVRAETARALKGDSTPATRDALAGARERETVPFVKALLE
ncbi:MAG: HEAT repeat domain-containing protein [Polyangiaceae bacterium]